MNTFEYSFYIEEKLYNVYIDSSDDKKKRIVINNIELINEDFTLNLNRKAYIIYYPIELGNNELVISIDDTPIFHKYNIYLNGISLLDKTDLKESYDKAAATVKNGFVNFMKANWSETFKNNFISLIFTAFVLGGATNYTVKTAWLKVLLIIVLVALTLPLFLWLDWLNLKDIIKKYDSCFRPKVKL